MKKYTLSYRDSLYLAYLNNSLIMSEKFVILTCNMEFQFQEMYRAMQSYIHKEKEFLQYFTLN